MRLKAVGVFLGMLVVFMVSGCASSPTAKQEEDFVEKWLRQSETARGYSPQVSQRDVLEIEGAAPGLDEFIFHEPQRKLPGENVTLRLSDAPVDAVLRAMARAAGLNMLISDTVRGQMSVDIQNVPWNHAFASIVESRGLAWSWDGDILRIRSMEDIQNEIELSKRLQALQVQRLGEGRAGPLANRIIKINYADAEKLSDNLVDFLSRDLTDQVIGRIVVNQETNSLLIQATREDMDRIARMIDHLDRPRAQIQIEANIVEANQETARELGMRWSGRYVRDVRSSASIDEFGITGEPTVPLESFMGAGGMSLGVIAGRATGNVLYADLQALQRDGKLNILSSPSITTLDNQMAYTEHGEKVPYETTDIEGRREVEFEDAVLRLEVLPSIIDGEFMKMNIKVKKDEVDFTQTVNGNPLIKRKETETNLVVRDGETIVISGLSKQTVTGIDEGVPMLKNIPLLGWLFKGESKSEEMEEFLIFITPTILGVSGS